MRSFYQSRLIVCALLIVAGMFCCGFWGSTKKDIDVKGIKSVAIVPFQYAHFKDFSEKAGDIVAENMNDIFADKCEWTCTPVDQVKAAMKELKIKPKNPMTEANAKAIGDKLGVDMVIYGNLPVYDEREDQRDIQESGGGGFTENIRELKVEYDMFLLKVSDGSLIINVQMDRKERDTAKHPMQPDPPENQMKNATRRMAKKLAKRFIME